MVLSIGLYSCRFSGCGAHRQIGSYCILCSVCAPYSGARGCGWFDQHIPYCKLSRKESRFWACHRVWWEVFCWWVLRVVTLCYRI